MRWFEDLDRVGLLVLNDKVAAGIMEMNSVFERQKYIPYYTWRYGI